MPPRTIDNLGVDASSRYAEDQKVFDENFINETRTIPLQAGIEVTAPFFPPGLAELLQLQPTGITWASFAPPSGYFEQKKRLFTYQLIPSMGSEDKTESQAQKILAKLKSMAIQKSQETKETQNKRQQYEADRALEEEEKEKKILTSLLDTIALFDKLIIEINSRRTQYQKG